MLHFIILMYLLAHRIGFSYIFCSLGKKVTECTLSQPPNNYKDFLHALNTNNEGGLVPLSVHLFYQGISVT
jgi:hypothetical protein